MKGAINHIALTVGDLAAHEAAFHKPILKWLGYEKVEAYEGEMTLWYHSEANCAVNLWQAKGGTHEKWHPGLHHIAFSADSAADIDECHNLLQDIGATVLDAPAEYPQYAPGYYAVYFTDPDGMKWELAHMPVIPD